MKLPFLNQAYSTSHNSRKTAESEYAILFRKDNYTFHRSIISFLLRLLVFSRLIIRLLFNGYQPQIRQGRDREHNLYWYAYYPLSGASKFLASEAEIQQLLEFRQEI